MRSPLRADAKLSRPELLTEAVILDKYLKTFSVDELVKVMNISNDLARKTHQRIQDWTPDVHQQIAAADSFIGDIYSGLRAHLWNSADRHYAQQTLRILSGLYGILRPLDGIYPYRLEMGYKLPNEPYTSLYGYWADRIAACIPKDQPIINLASVEYSKTVTPFVDAKHITTPTFLTHDPKTNEPVFRTVHAKIARGAFANWLITKRITSEDVTGFSDIGYSYYRKLSQPNAPVYVCQTFGGIGLSMRLK